jgi:crotonobetainyl-CoA:carnitine CoA-transferase CaiB-like acyl-CoA transferase
LSSDLVYSRNNASYDPHAGFASGHSAPLMRAYKTSDGRFIQLMLLAPDKPWPELCEMIGQRDLATDLRFATNPDRIKNGAELCDILDKAFRARSWADWAPSFFKWNAPWELISNLEELGNDPQLQAAGTVFKMPLKSGEEVDVIARPIGFDDQCAPSKPVCSPSLGEHSDEVLSSIGISADDLARMRTANIIG